MVMAVLEGPVRNLSPRTFNQLACALEPHSARGNDWEGLADFVGFPTQEILAIRSQGECTIRVFTAWDNSGRSSVRKLIIALICLERVDCVRVLEEEPALQGGFGTSGSFLFRVVGFLAPLSALCVVR